MRSEKEYYRDYEKRFNDALLVADEGMRGYADVPRQPVFSVRRKRPSLGLRDYSLRKTLDFKGHWIEVDCQMAASDMKRLVRS